MDNYVKVRKIGEGSFGKALLVKRKSDKKQCVIKEIGISKMNSKERAESRKEVQLLSQLKHPNIVSYLESFESSGNLYIVMDYCEGGDLYQMIVSQRGLHISESKVLDIFVQCCLAVKHIHDRKILHRDIKTQNIFLTRNHIVKLGDFGIARVLKNTMELARTCIGTPYYLSPEIVENRPYNNKSDIWSLGCVLYELSTLKHAFEAGNMKALVMKIVRGSYPPLPNKYSHELRALVAHCFKRAPSDRPSITTLLRKPIIQQRISKFLSPEKLEEEFKNAVSSNQANINSRPTSAVSNKAAIKRPAVKKSMDPALIYGVSISKKPSPVRKPISAIHKDQKFVSKAPANNYKKLQDAREKRRKEILAQEKQYQNHIKNLHEQRWQKQQQALMNKARQDGWKNILSVGKDESKTNAAEERILKSPDDEKPKGGNNNEPLLNQLPVRVDQCPVSVVEHPVSANKHPVNIKQRPVSANENPVRPQQEDRYASQIQSSNSSNSERGRLLEEFWQRKNAAALNKAKGQQEFNNAPDNPLLQFHQQEMARQGHAVGDVNFKGGARNRQEMEYLKQLEAIRKQNFLERKAVKAYAVNQPGHLYQPSQPNKNNNDPRFDPDARKAKIAALKEQAEQRAILLREQLELRKRQAMVRLERERIDRMKKYKEDQNANKVVSNSPNEVPEPEERPAVPAVGIETALNQIEAPKLFRSCSEGDLQNMVSEVKIPHRKNWKKGVPQAPFEFINMPMEITSSAMEATVVEEREEQIVEKKQSDVILSRKHWQEEGKTQFVSMLHNIALSETKQPTIECESSLPVAMTLEEARRNEARTITIDKSSSSQNSATVTSTVVKKPAIGETIIISSRKSDDCIEKKELIERPGQKDGKELQDEELIEEIFLSEQEVKTKRLPSEKTSGIDKQSRVDDQSPSEPIYMGSAVKNDGDIKHAWNEISQDASKELVGVTPDDNSVAQGNNVTDNNITAQDNNGADTPITDDILIAESNIEEIQDESFDDFFTPDRKLLLQTGSYDTQRKMLRTCSLPNLRDDVSSPTPTMDDNNMNDNEDEDEMKVDDDDNMDDVSDVEELEEEECADYESMLESMRGLLNSTDDVTSKQSDPIDDDGACQPTLVNNFLEEKDEEEWGSEEEEEDMKKNNEKFNHLNDTLFSRIEESRKHLEDELGFDLFMKIYKHVQMIQENDDEDAELGSNEINDLLGEKDYLYQKVLYLVMADSAYCEGNDGD